MRRIAQVSVVAALAVLVAGCGGGADETAPAPDETSAEVAVGATGPEVSPAPAAAPAQAAQTAAAPLAAASASAAAATSAAPAASPVAAAAAPPAAFMQCRACHSINPGQHGIGPSLAGVFGTKAGDIPGYRFSDAMNKSGLVWDELTLDKFLQAPAKIVPGTKMVYAGMPDREKRADVIAYIKSLK